MGTTVSLVGLFRRNRALVESRAVHPTTWRVKRGVYRKRESANRRIPEPAGCQDGSRVGGGSPCQLSSSFVVCEAPRPSFEPDFARRIARSYKRVTEARDASTLQAWRPTCRAAGNHVVCWGWASVASRKRKGGDWGSGLRVQSSEFRVQSSAFDAPPSSRNPFLHTREGIPERVGARRDSRTSVRL